MAKFNQDDIVKSKTLGHGKVAKIDCKIKTYPVIVKFDGVKDSKSFTSTGRYYVGTRTDKDIKKVGLIGKIIYNLFKRKTLCK